MNRFFLLLALGLTSGLISGCNRSVAKNALPEPVPAASYKAQRGLQLTPLALETIGVKSAGVTTRAINEVKDVAAIPASALLRTVKGDFVYVANGGWFLRTPVTLGATDGAWFEIKEGLYEGDRVVTEGTRGLWLAELQAVNGGVGCADGH